MRRRVGFPVILILAMTAASVKAQYASINVDAETMEVMTAAYGAAALTESAHLHNLEKIYGTYKQAAVASSGIFSSKYLDRRALTSLDLWDDRNENYYYTRIYRIVTQGIIPQTVHCAELLIEDPVNSIYWGSYMLKTTEDVMSLCKQFETVVTNSKLDFKDIAFVEISDQLKDIFNITRIGGMDWRNIFEHLFDDIQGSFTKEKLMDDLNQLIMKGTGLAQAGAQGVVDQAMQGTDFGGTIADKIGSVITLVDNAGDMYDQYKDMSAAQVLTSIVGEDEIEGLFKLGDYNVTRWIDDYASAAEGDYYTQRVYIYYGDSGSERLCNYTPPTDAQSVVHGSEWTRIYTQDVNYNPSTAEFNAALDNSESFAGWSRQRVQMLNAAGEQNGEHYNFESHPITIHMNGMEAGVFGTAIAFHIDVTKTWDKTETVYEDVFDSYSMDWNTFMNQINTRLRAFNEAGDNSSFDSSEDLQSYMDSHPEEASRTYNIGYDERHYYKAADNRMVKGSSTATFTVTCSDGGKLGSGSTTYKCEHCGKEVSEHTKQCSMLTTIDGGGDDVVGELQKQLTQKQAEAVSLQSRIDALNAENSRIMRELAQTINDEEYASLQQQWNANADEIRSLQQQLEQVNQDIRELQSGITEAEQEAGNETDDYERIPYLMDFMKDTYGIRWLGDGSWSGTTFTREGTMVGSKEGTVKFTANLSIIRKPKWVFGVQVHRAIVQIDWEMTSSWSESTVAEILQLDPEQKEEETARIVNDRLSELAREYPSCEVRVECNRTPGLDSIQDNTGTYHLLWASDRLEIARDIEHRLVNIHVQLVNLNKFLHYRHGVRDMLETLLPRLNADRDRRFNIAEQSRRRWMLNAGSGKYESDAVEDP